MIARRFFRGATCAFVVVVVQMTEAAVYSVAFVVWMSVCASNFIVCVTLSNTIHSTTDHISCVATQESNRIFDFSFRLLT